jgi:Ohr subfamily peroxiredoxin
MIQLEKVIYTAKTHTTGGRDQGTSCSSDGRLDVRLSRPGASGDGTNPEQLFAAGWSACFISAMKIAAGKMKVALPDGLAIDATFDRTAASFDNPDHVAIVIHNYRWRLELAEGEPKYADLEKRLAQSPVISVPTITMEGDANGAPHPDPATYAKKFSGPYEHRQITGGIGHNLPQEAPQAFAQAIADIAAS